MAYTPTFRPVRPPQPDEIQETQGRDGVNERPSSSIMDAAEDLLLPQYRANPIPSVQDPIGNARPKGAKKR